MRLFFRMRAILREKRGFTLIELIAAMAVSTILLLGVVMAIPNVQKNYVSTIERSYARTMANTIAANLRDQLTFATSVSLSDPDTDGGYTTITYSRSGAKPATVKPDSGGDGYSQLEGLTYDPSGAYFMGKKAKLRFSKADDTICTASIHIYLDGQELYKMERDISILNLAGDEIEAD